MPCEKCIKKPGYHSFVKFGSLNEMNLFYTAPAKTEDLDADGTKLDMIKLHMIQDTQGDPWIWVLDCTNMSFKHYMDFSFTYGLLNHLASDKNIQGVCVLNSNFWIRSTHTILNSISSAEILKNVKYFDGTKLEIMAQLNSVGFDTNAVNWLTLQ